MGLKGLGIKLEEMRRYLQQVIDGKLPMNHQITYQLQDIFNLLPNLTNPDFVKSVNVNTNDQMLVVYTASLIRDGFLNILHLFHTTFQPTKGFMRDK